MLGNEPVSSAKSAFNPRALSAAGMSVVVLVQLLLGSHVGETLWL